MTDLAERPIPWVELAEQGYVLIFNVTEIVGLCGVAHCPLVYGHYGHHTGAWKRRREKGQR